MFFAAFNQIYFVLGPWKGYFSPITIFYTTLVLFGAMAHTKCQLTNPGTVPLEVKKNKKKIS